ncbi:unnamed protein product [Ambrosiozyma monospora]|uniref:Unnamed protein product n=1 Tax=Ambrosiozyma monospora TaxID=43982 RepID=A0ACB5SVK7_AMBMO|nr:unnamed protein product [Ambrosiozyma monospora]
MSDFTLLVFFYAVLNVLKGIEAHPIVFDQDNDFNLDISSNNGDENSIQSISNHNKQRHIDSHFDKKDTENQGYVKFIGEKQTNEVSITSSLKQVVNDNVNHAVGASLNHVGGIRYMMNVTIGSTQQPISVQIDTGSSAFWVINSNNSFCETTSQGEGQYAIEQKKNNYNQIIDGSRGNTDNSNRDCSEYGTFDPWLSSSWYPLGTSFHVGYMDGTGANGTWGTDVVNVNGAQIDDVFIAQSDETNENYGVLGIGYQTSKTGYDTLPMSMKKQGLINQNTYSIYLDDYTATDSAVVLFGAIDHNKYIGNLGLLPVASPNKQLDVYLNKIIASKLGSPFDTATDSTSNTSSMSRNIVSNSTIATGSMKALLDTGASNSQFPGDVIEAFMDEFNLKNYSNILAGNCSDIDQFDLTFDFMGFKLSVPLSGFISAQYGDICMLSISKTKHDYVTLGDSFLRNVYYVVDLDNNQIALALANLDSDSESSSETIVDDEDIEVISGTIPSATPAPNYSTNQTSLMSGLYVYPDMSVGSSLVPSIDHSSFAVRRVNVPNFSVTYICFGVLIMSLMLLV